MCAYYSSFIPQFATLVKPLYWLTGENVKLICSDKQENAFNGLKGALCNDVILNGLHYLKKT